MARTRSPFAIAAVLAVVALLGLLAYGLSQNEPDREIEQALDRGERKRGAGLHRSTGSRAAARARSPTTAARSWC